MLQLISIIESSCLRQLVSLKCSKLSVTNDHSSLVEFLDEFILFILSKLRGTSSTEVTTIYLPPMSSLFLKLSLKVA